MQKIGEITLLQVQQFPSKTQPPADNDSPTKRDTRVYSPKCLTAVPRIQVTSDGIIGHLSEFKHILDVHHIHHPNSRNRDNTNGISVGFTSHYRQMRTCYGEHMVDGVGGENIIVDVDDRVLPDELGTQIAIRNQVTGEFIYFDHVMAAPPCLPFSQFTANKDLTPEETKDVLQFLGDGRRGYYATLSPKSTGELIIQDGDSLYTSE